MMKRYVSADNELLLGPALRDLAIAFVLFVLLLICWPFNSVPTGSRGVITQFGRIIGIAPEGMALLWPWQRLALFSIRSETATIDNASGATSDIQPVTVSLTVRYSIETDKVAEVYEKYSHNGDLSSYVNTATQEVFKAITSRHDAPELLTRRALVSAEINSALSTKLAVYGAHVISIDMRNFEFTPQYWAATNQKTVQEQLKLAADNKLKTVESEQRQKVAIAEAEASAVRAQADGAAYATVAAAKAEAEQTKLNADAQAHAIDVQQAALARGGQVLELRRIQVDQTKADRWNGQLPAAVYAGAPIPFLQAGK